MSTRLPKELTEEKFSTAAGCCTDELSQCTFREPTSGFIKGRPADGKYAVRRAVSRWKTSGKDLPQSRKTGRNSGHKRQQAFELKYVQLNVQEIKLSFQKFLWGSVHHRLALAESPLLACNADSGHYCPDNHK
jgi:hypothetical protein